MSYQEEIGKFKAIEHFAKNVRKTLEDIDKKREAYGNCDNQKKSISLSNDIDRLKLQELIEKHELHRLCVYAGVADYNEERYKTVEFGLFGGHNRQSVRLKEPDGFKVKLMV